MLWEDLCIGFFRFIILFAERWLLLKTWSWTFFPYIYIFGGLIIFLPRALLWVVSPPALYCFFLASLVDTLQRNRSTCGKRPWTRNEESNHFVQLSEGNWPEVRPTLEKVISCIVPLEA